MPVHREVEEVFPCSEHDPQIKSEQPFDVSVHARDTNAINPYYVNNSYLHPGGGGPRQMEGASLQADSSGRRSWDVTEVNEVAEQLNQCPSPSRTRITSAPSSSRSTPGRTHRLGKTRAPAVIDGSNHRQQFPFGPQTMYPGQFHSQAQQFIPEGPYHPPYQRQMHSSIHGDPIRQFQLGRYQEPYCNRFHPPVPPPMQHHHLSQQEAMYSSRYAYNNMHLDPGQAPLPRHYSTAQSSGVSEIGHGAPQACSSSVSRSLLCPCLIYQSFILNLRLPLLCSFTLAMHLFPLIAQQLKHLLLTNLASIM